MSHSLEFYLVKDVAKALRVNQTHVLNWIHSGELKAVNTSDPGKRPRWKISRQAFDDFCDARSSKPAEPAKPKRRGKPAGVTEYV